MKTKKTNKKNMRKRKMMYAVLAAGAISITALTGIVSTTQSVKAESVTRYKYYTTVYVDRDTTLWNVSKQYISDEYADMNDYMNEVIKINRLSADGELEYGTTICVPYYSSELKF